MKEQFPRGHLIVGQHHVFEEFKTKLRCFVIVANQTPTLEVFVYTGLKNRQGSRRGKCPPLPIEFQLEIVNLALLRTVLIP